MPCPPVIEAKPETTRREPRARPIAATALAQRRSIPGHRRRGSAGFSLLEVLIAFAIASLALTALLQIYATSATSARRSVNMAMAVEIADNRLAMLADPALLAPGVTAGTDELGFAWRMEIDWDSEALPKDAPLRLFHISVAVAAPGDPRPILTVFTARTARWEVR